MGGSPRAKGAALSVNNTLLSWLDAEGEDELEMDKNGLIVLIQGWIDGMPDDFIIESVKMKIADGQS